MSPFVLWPLLAGAVFLLAGIIAVRRDLRADPLVLAFPCFAAPLAAFGAEHLAAGSLIAGTVPAWMPFHIFWVYFFGVAQIAAALGLTLRRSLRLTLALVALMFLLFVATIHIPNVFAHPHQRLFYTLVLRDTAFALGPLALLGALIQRRSLVDISRAILAPTLLFFGIQMCLYPAFAPGVPLGKLTPAWVPWPLFWAYASGAILILCSIALLVRRCAHLSAGTAGALMAVLTIALYLPILIMARGAPALLDGLNYVFDTLLFAGALFLLARALPTS